MRRLLESLQADDMPSRELVHELETMVDVEHFTIDQGLDFWGVITSSPDGYHSDGLPIYELPRHMIVPLRILLWKCATAQRFQRAADEAEQRGEFQRAEFLRDLANTAWTL